MTFGAPFAALLALLAAVDAQGAGSAAPAPAAAAAEAADAEEAPDAGPPATPDLPGSIVAAPSGDPLAESAAVLVDRIERPDGWAVERLVEPSGDIVDHLVNHAGTVQSCRRVGTLFTAAIVEQRPAPAGEVVEVVRDGSGALLRLVVQADGYPRAVALLAPPPR
jgi:pyruvate/2-oxoglutarate dehydrogenase complex dihydrolipoamide acyltransferase (E2) component